MSLRLRVLAAFAAVLALGLGLGLLLALWDARQTLREELGAAMVGGRQTVASAFEDLPRSDHPDRDLRQLIATFDDSRHVSAVLMTPAGPRAASFPYRGGAAAPAWFANLLDPRLPTITLAAPVGAAAIVLRPAPQADIADAWRLGRHTALALGLACGLGLGLVYVTMGRALRPLGALTGALARVGAGDYAARVSVRRPRELVRLGQSFNAMAGELEAMRRRTRLLEEQVLRLQDEERADIARDLHDEMGPHLFAANIDATMLSQALAAGRTDEAQRHVRSIQGAVSHMQRLVREILERLRPAQLTELGFRAAVEDLVDFWRARRPDIAFEVELAFEAAAIPEPLQEAAYRIAQEGLSNAVRHARPRRIALSVATDAGQLQVRVENDGPAPPPSPTAAAPRRGFGLVGMRERIEAVGGALTIDPVPGRGWTITARAPLSSPSSIEASDPV